MFIAKRGRWIHYSCWDKGSSLRPFPLSAVFIRKARDPSLETSLLAFSIQEVGFTTEVFIAGTEGHADTVMKSLAGIFFSSSSTPIFFFFLVCLSNKKRSHSQVSSSILKLFKSRLFCLLLSRNLVPREYISVTLVTLYF